MFLSKLFKHTRAKVLTALAGLTMVFGAAATISTVTATQQNEVVETKAADMPSGTILYFRIYSGFFDASAKAYVCFNNGNNQWQENLLNTANTILTAGSETLYWYSLPSVAKDLQIKRYNSSKTEEWGKAPYVSGDTSKNFYEVTGYGSGQSMNGGWVSASIKKYYFKAPTNGTVTLAPKDGNGTSKSNFSTNTEYYVYSDWTVEYTATASMGYQFTTWTESTSKSGTYTPWGSSGTSNPHTVSCSQDLYHSATFSIKTYTITFYQNDDSGEEETDTKTHGVDYTIPEPADLGMGASGGRYFIEWNTDEHGSGTRYLPDATYSTDSDLNLYMIQDWYHYWYSLDNKSNWTEMIHDDTGRPGGYDAQFRTNDITLTAGATIYLARTTSSTFSDEELVSVRTWDRNVDDGVIQVTSSGKIYLKITRMGLNDVTVEGGTGERWIEVAGVRYEMTKSTDTDWYTTTLVTIMPNVVIKGGYSSDDPYNLTTAIGDGDFTGGTSVVCNAPGVFTVHIYKTGTYEWNGVNMVMDTTGSAILFAQTFNSAIETVCNGILNKTKTLDNLKTAWGMSSSAGQNRYYNSLTTEAKTAVKTGSSDGNVVACRAKYDYVGGLYRDTLPDFMGRSGYFAAMAIPSASSNDQSPLTMTLWIVLGCGVAGLGAIGTAYFVSKKKGRHQA